MTVAHRAQRRRQRDLLLDTEDLSEATAQSSNTYFVALAAEGFNCQLQPIVNMAKSLGMTGLDQPSYLKGQNVGQTIVSQQAAQYLVLGSVPTSPLQLAAAYATVANKGRYNAPAPILSITDSTGNAIAVKRTAATQVVSPYVAAQALQILEGDTDSSEGTSYSRFTDWYAKGGSEVAGKTGTIAAVKNGHETTKNASVWFVGVTKQMAAASALINFDFPNKASKGLPGVATGAAYGDYASKVWVNSLGPSLLSAALDVPDHRRRQGWAGSRHQGLQPGRRPQGAGPSRLQDVRARRRQRPADLRAGRRHCRQRRLLRTRGRPPRLDDLRLQGPRRRPDARAATAAGDHPLDRKRTQQRARPQRSGGNNNNNNGNNNNSSGGNSGGNNNGGNSGGNNAGGHGHHGH